MAISKFQNVKNLTPKISKNRYFWENVYKIQYFDNFEINGIYVIDPHVYYLHTKFYPSPWQGIFHNTSWQGVGRCDPPGVSKLSVVALRKKYQSIALDEFSRLVAYFLLLVNI